jgi:polyhydroxybutyrate depolymerase
MSATAMVHCGSEPTLNFFNHGGLKREYYTYFPSRACEVTDTKAEQPKVPFIVAMHCFGSSWEGEFKKHKAVADQKGIALLMPLGITKSWNAIECCGVALKKDLDDVGFITAAVNEMLGEGHIDSGAVFATGFSNGLHFIT